MAHVVIIGLGLIGGSLARDLRRGGHRVTACGRDAGKLAPAVGMGIVDAVADDWAEALADADCVVLGTPVGALRETYASVRPHLPPTAVVTDVGSTKGSVVHDIAAACGGSLPSNFVPGHPIAGTENSGFAASVEGLFNGRTVVLTPTADTDPAATARVAALWQEVGARVIELEPQRHDAALALTSHLPQMLAYTLMGQFAEVGEPLADLVGSGFRGMTRLAGSDPAMWRDVALANRAQLSLALHRYGERLGELAAAVEAGDAVWLEELFTAAQAAQRQLPPAPR